VDLLAGAPKWRKIAGRVADVRDISLVGDQVYLLACGRQSKGEIVRVNCGGETFDSSKVMLPAADGVIDLMAAARDGLYVHEILEGVEGVKRVAYDGTIERVVPPGPGSAWNIMAALDEPGAWFQMDDLAWPGSAFRVPGDADLHAVESRLVSPPAYDVTRFTTTRVKAPSRDGVSIPLEILHRKDVRKTGRNPVLIIAYGAYGVVLDPGFQPRTLAFLEAGGVIAYAHVRGGGEKGEAWHKAGFKATKPNTWRDAIDSAEFLILEHWTGKRHLAIWGTSAGGIMVGGAITERPDLFAAAICDVGVFNTLRMELTANGPGNDAEFGTVKKEAEFHDLLAMDAYHKVKDGVRYPACLLLTGANDKRVESWQVAKFAARLQAATTNPRGALLRVDYEAGHHATSHAVENAMTADIYGFVLANTV
jgi:prolyl oligopeptidase